MKDLKVWDRVDCSDHGMAMFRSLRRGSRIKSRIITLGFKKRDSGLFRDLLGGSPWKTAQEIWLIFRHDLLETQEWSTAVENIRQIW